MDIHSYGLPRSQEIGPCRTKGFLQQDRERRLFENAQEPIRQAFQHIGQRPHAQEAGNRMGGASLSSQHIACWGQAERVRLSPVGV